KGASNAYAASPSRSAAGSTLMANDPHVALSAPSLWYLARLELNSGGVIGATIPGLPLILSGRSERLAWGITSSHVDDQDLYVEEFHPEKPAFYRTEDGFKAFKNQPSIINIKNQSPVTMTLRWSKNGPILSSNQYNLGQVTPKNHVIALASTALRGNDRSLSSGFDLMRAGSVIQGLDALETFQAPSLNVVLSDKREIAIKTIGLRPKRHQDHQTLGRMPSLGWQEKNQWQGFLAYRDAPQSINPESGLIANTNNKLTDKAFPNHGSYDWGDSQRIKRLDRLLTDRPVHTQQSFMEAQLDTVSFTARTLLPLVGGEFWFTGENGAPGTIERDRYTALSLLGEWDGNMNEHLPEPLIYSAWMRALQDRLIRDEIGPLADTFIHLEPLFIERVFRDVEGAAQWCDIVQSSPVETCRDIADLALNDAITSLKETYGGSIEALRWGDAHQATHLHMALGQIPLLKYTVNIYQSTSGGDHTLQRGRTKGRGANPFQNVHAAGYRGIYDFADPDSSLFVIATGQSGHPLSRHYDDLGQLWRRGEYWTMSLDKNLVSAASVGQTIIHPIDY
ncbi:MAG: penicillin acylase family protein, partial [Paracoccaceae bacterium]|nr:penicillin acylase family protein [Paracoccaceae bacterium]